MNERDAKQREANRLDLATFRLVSQLERFAEEHKDSRLSSMTAVVNAIRYRLRDHMHKEDREKTE